MSVHRFVPLVLSLCGMARLWISFIRWFSLVLYESTPFLGVDERCG